MSLLRSSSPRVTDRTHGGRRTASAGGGSTPLAEQLGPTRMREIIDRFYTEGVDVLCHGGAMVDRFMGDQIVGYFVPLYAPVHPRSRSRRGLALLKATGNGSGQEPWIPIGVGV